MNTNNFDFKITNEYNPHNNFLYTTLCKLVYEEEDAIKAQVAKWKVNIPNLNCIVKTVEQHILKAEEMAVKGFWDKTSRFMVLYDNDFIILAFRGSSNFVDWIKDLRRTQINFEEGQGKVHLGFYQTVKNMRDPINEVMTEIRRNNQKLFITGHSLGGAQALLSPFMCDSLKDFHQITTFGQPRVGDKKFRDWVNPQIDSDKGESSKYFRVVNKLDPVTAIPYINYFHCGGFYINCDKDKYYNLELKFKALPMLLGVEESPEEGAELKMAIPIISNHFMDLYVENAERNDNFSPFEI